MPLGSTHPTSESENCHTHFFLPGTTNQLTMFFKLSGAANRTHYCSITPALTDCYVNTVDSDTHQPPFSRLLRHADRILEAILPRPLHNSADSGLHTTECTARFAVRASVKEVLTSWNSHTIICMTALAWWGRMCRAETRHNTFLQTRRAHFGLRITSSPRREFNSEL